MLKVTIIELLFRAVPEWLLLMSMAYVISEKKFDIRKIIISSFIGAPIDYFVRMLPIHFGVHIIIGLLTYLIVCALFNKIDIIKSISSALISTMIFIICEGLNMVILQYLIGINIEQIFNNPILKLLYGIPSLAVFAISIFIIHFINKKRRRDKQSVFN